MALWDQTLGAEDHLAVVCSAGLDAERTRLEKDVEKTAAEEVALGQVIQEATVVRQVDEAKWQVLEQAAEETRADEVAAVQEVVVLNAVRTRSEEEVAETAAREAELVQVWDAAGQMRLEK